MRYGEASRRSVTPASRRSGCVTWRALALATTTVALACGPAKDVRNAASGANASGREMSPSGVPLTSVERDGDPATGVALAVAVAGTGDSAVLGAAALSGSTPFCFRR